MPRNNPKDKGQFLASEGKSPPESATGHDSHDRNDDGMARADKPSGGLRAMDLDSGDRLGR